MLWRHCPNTHQSLAVGTWALALFALWTVIDNRAALEESQRAWIAPSVQLIGPIAKDQVLKIRVIFGNSGKEPALNTVRQSSFGVAPLTLTNDNTPIMGRFADNNECASLSPKNGSLTVYPTSANYFWDLLMPINIDDDILNAKKLIFLNACFVYESFQKRHESAFCFYLRPEWGVPPDKWVFNHCPSGNYAN
jgi:hypothetical protein